MYIAASMYKFGDIFLPNTQSTESSNCIHIQDTKLLITSQISYHQMDDLVQYCSICTALAIDTAVLH